MCGSGQQDHFSGDMGPPGATALCRIIALLRGVSARHQTRSPETGIQIASASWEEPTVLSPCSAFAGCVISYGPMADRWGCSLGDRRVAFPSRWAL